MHILFITDNFPPESNAPATRTFEHAKAWVAAGHQVTVITCAPNFPSGKVFAGYHNSWRSVESMSGIKVIRVKTFITSNEGFLKRILDYASFGIMSAIVGAMTKGADVVIGTSPQPFAVISAWLITRIRRRPFVFELRDLWPESITAVSAMKESFLLRIFRKFIYYLYKKADLIISVTDSFKAKLVSRGIQKDKIKVIKNGVDLSISSLATEDPNDLRVRYDLPRDKFICAYIGTIGMAHSVQTIIDCARQCTNESLHFLIMGAGAQAKTIAEQSNSLDNVTFLPSKSRIEALNILQSVDAAIVHLKDDPVFREVIPSKIFEIMCLSKPILMGVLGESRQIVVHDAQAGLPFEPQNPESLCAVATEIASKPEVAKSMGSNGSQYVKHNFSRPILAKQMLDEIMALTAKRNKQK